jgi:hypothetical protein
MNPDGWQVIVSIEQVSATRAIISDRGETLAKLNNSGVDLDFEITRRLFLEKLQVFGLINDGNDLKKEINVPLNGVDVQLFAEALVSIGHLVNRHEPAKLRSEHVYHQVRSLLRRTRLKFIEGSSAFISGRTEKQIGVDFLIQENRSIACKSVERRGRMRDYMEQWGYRWLDAKKSDDLLVTAMFYDPENQQWDDGSIAIGRDVCDIFRPYHDIAAIEADLKRFASAA